MWQAKDFSLPDVRESRKDDEDQVRMKLLKARPFNPGDKKHIDREKSMSNAKFSVHKFNNRKRPTDKSRILIISCFSEFGCESIALTHCIPKIIQKNPGSYIICVGWYGREYLYRHLADEFWELSEDGQWLREYSLAFRHTSKNLEKIEKSLENYGRVFRGSYMGHICLGNTCRSCKNFWGDENPEAVCGKCGSDDIERSLLADIFHHKRMAVQVPRPSIRVMKEAAGYLKPNPVGIFARGRVCYGRNLPPDFYVRLIELLEKMGYNPIWLGEKQSVLPCPVPRITDFSRLPESRNLELTLAIISQLQFTIQFWTASTRFASMMGVPWILFESPEQIVGQGQEGMRIALTTDFNKKKMVLAQYLSVMENQDEALLLAERAVREMNEDNWEDIVGLVEHPELIKGMLKKQDIWRNGL